MDNAIGVLGLGIMGGAMARNMMARGLAVIGYDPSEDALTRFREAGGVPKSSIRDVVAEASILLTALPTVDAFMSVTQAIAAAGLRDKTVIELSVMPLDAKVKARDLLEQAGCILLDCPVSGTGAQAQTGDLVIFASGDETAYEHSRELLETFSRKQVYLGEFGNGTKMKLVANHLVAIHNVAAAEAFTLAEKAGIEPGVVYDALEDSAGTSRMFQVRGPLMVKGDYSEPTARISMFLKDLNIIGDFAAQMCCPTPVFGAAAQLYYAAYNQGLADMDTAAVCRVLEASAGVDRQV